MKRPVLFFLISLCVLVTVSCKDKEEKDTVKTVPREGVNAWIEETMRTDYLWNDEIPALKKLNGSLEPDKFFNSLLSQKDGKHTNGKDYFYSYMEKKETELKSSINAKNSYGFDWILYLVDEGGPYFARVLYVLPNSAAADGGLKRGDWIVKVNNKEITQDNYENCLMQGQGGEYYIARFDTKDSLFVPSAIKTLEPSRPVDDNPVFLDTVFSIAGKNIGYLVYNHFTTGPDGVEDHTYDDRMKMAFARLKQQNVNELVLDLRYNSGGYLTCSQLLASMIAPANCLGKEYCYLETNKYLNEKESIPFLTSVSAENLNLNRVYVLTSEYTASSSELIINGLRPYMNVVLVGVQTEGKNVGSLEYEKDEYDWILHPIISKIYNSQRMSDYENGFSPNYMIDEFDSILDYYDLGDTNEIVLKRALSVISGNFLKSSSTYNYRIPSTMKIKTSSLDRRKTQGVMLNGVKKFK